jgi:hypothetical protein
MRAAEAAAMLARDAEMGASLLVTAARAKATQAVEVEAMAATIEVIRVRRQQKTPMAAAIQVGAAMPTTTKMLAEGDAGEGVRAGSTARPSSRK